MYYSAERQRESTHQKKILFVFWKTMSKDIFQVFLMPKGKKLLLCCINNLLQVWESCVSIRGEKKIYHI